MISSMYPENLIFDGSQHRTIRMNEAIRVFDSLKGLFDSKKKGKSGINLDLPTKVTVRYIEPQN
jgi:site-specific DNA recombinase